MAGPDAALINSRIPKLVEAKALADRIVSQVQAKLPRAGEGDDHVFVVIGRREGSDVSKYNAQTWGSDGELHRA